MQEVEKKFKFLQVNGSPLSIYVSDELFMPNQTTAAVAEAVTLHPEERGIEIGAGIGPISILLASRSELGHLYTVEYVEKQLNLARRNIAKYGLEGKITPYQGNIFDPIRQNHPEIQVDFIVSDISGMAEVPARALDWYPSAIPTGGIDGADKVISLIEQASQFLKPTGRLYFPVVVNFSDGDKILTVAKKHFTNVVPKSRTSLPLPADLYSKVKDLNTSSGVYAPFEQRGSRFLWHLDVYEATQPKSRE
ncbi:MAG: methyltransferase [Nanoarchaeota archaeon]